MTTTENATDLARARYQAAKAAVDAVERAGLAETIAGEEFKALVARMSAGEDAVFEAPVATLTDAARKLAVISDWNGAHNIEPERIDAILAQVRAATGRAA